ncbi:MAG: translation initiation factor IF-2 [Bacteroidales bacterium]|nr:translation initiation factor IF-2 [Bacteroidales bacterium]MDY6427534.1 translation initiation factor IF-2 [Bacteroidales bacterium]
MSVKLNKVVKEFNISLSTAVEYLHKNGFPDVKEDVNGRIQDDEYELLKKAFGEDKKEKKLSDFFSFRRKDKDKDKEKQAQTVIQPKPEEAEPIVLDSERIQIKQVGHIDLDEVGKKKVEEPVAVEKPEEPEVSEPQPVAVETKEEPDVEEPEVEDPQVVEPQIEEVPEEEEPETPEEPDAADEEDDEPEPQESEEDSNHIKIQAAPIAAPKVLGKIDLDSINQQTRPKKKTSEEKKKERESKYPPKKQKSAQVDAASVSEEKRKRNRIKKDRVDISKNYDDSDGGKNQYKGKKDKYSSSRVQQTDEDVQKQVKETLAMLTSKQSKKSAKYRKDKREAAHQRMEAEAEAERLENQTIKITEFVTVNDLATMMHVPVTQVIGTCMNLGLFVSINQRLDAETINIVADEFGFKTQYISAEVQESIHEQEDKPEDLVPRPPIVTVMGHVDHGKTSLLDYIRKANVIAGEAGGITQHIGAYNVKLENGQHITFLDTPGHEAFTAMRARGAKVTDIAIIIVAADDDVMPQTVEAINHASAAGVPIVFAINKVDKPTANPDHIKERLANMNYLVEDWGGKYQSQDISAKTGKGVNELLEKVLLEAEMLDLKANPNKLAVGSIIESSLDKGRGYLATVLIEGGTLHVGDVVVAGTSFGRVKAMFNERNQRIKEVRPGEPVSILGLNGAPTAGDRLNAMESEQEAREVANKREQLKREQSQRTSTHVTLAELGRRIALGNFQELNIVVKGDVDGSVEALSDSFIKLSTPEIQVNVIHKAVGQISESDVMLAAASNAIVVGFQVRPSVDARRLAEKEQVDIRLYSIIYDAIEEVKDAMEGMLSPEIKEEVTATLEIMQVFKISKVGSVAGCLVRDGKVKRSNKVRLIRDGIVIYTGELGSLKRMKDDVKEVTAGFECGLNIAGYNDIQVGDLIETYEEIEVKKKL